MSSSVPKILVDFIRAFNEKEEGTNQVADGNEYTLIDAIEDIKWYLGEEIQLKIDIPYTLRDVEYSNDPDYDSEYRWRYVLTCTVDGNAQHYFIIWGCGICGHVTYSREAEIFAVDSIEEARELMVKDIEFGIYENFAMKELFQISPRLVANKILKNIPLDSNEIRVLLSHMEELLD